MTIVGSVTSVSPGSELGIMVDLIPNRTALLGRPAPPVSQPVPNGRSIGPKSLFSGCLSHVPLLVR